MSIQKTFKTARWCHPLLQAMQTSPRLWVLLQEPSHRVGSYWPWCFCSAFKMISFWWLQDDFKMISGDSMAIDNWFYWNFLATSHVSRGFFRWRLVTSQEMLPSPQTQSLRARPSSQTHRTSEICKVFLPTFEKQDLNNIFFFLDFFFHV